MSEITALRRKLLAAEAEIERQEKKLYDVDLHWRNVLNYQIPIAERRGAVAELRRLADVAEGKIGRQYVGVKRIDARLLRERADQLETGQ